MFFFTIHAEGIVRGVHTCITLKYGGILSKGWLSVHAENGKEWNVVGFDFKTWSPVIPIKDKLFIESMKFLEQAYIDFDMTGVTH